MHQSIRLALTILLPLSVISSVVAQELPQPDIDPTKHIHIPGISNYAAPQQHESLAVAADGNITLSAKLIREGKDIARGMVWRVFRPEAGADGNLPLVATARGGTTTFQLEPGSYLVHAAFGRAGATKRITVGRDPRRENIVLDAGGLKLNATLSDGRLIKADKLRFSISEGDEDAGERNLIMRDIAPGTVVRLNEGTYHVVSTYGGVNAIVRSDIRVEAGKLTEATIEHNAAEVTLKLVREHGGEAIADTAWSVLTSSGDPVRESVGAFASLVLSEGEYTAIAKNRDRIYQHDFTVKAGNNQDVEVLLSENAPDDAGYVD
ncbi:hypothetical protein [Limoniibacter endophyticus]|uniref:Carboxypeptidase family protein n=1 Tax=Limoniibacter endophyticus TaxID=1565040 RepID=A0A8J3GFR5_9HYPH|nr:hypothetical protein [Limoniibacter endophyticus]GHC60168.1 hypothetical protein GCM10010136_00020 [Limoniibacter endophyticus]